ncbi:MAG: PPA1309 family protein [Actinomycetota bacterium]|nr:PPA1309 family protein [Actinomycetota bacterium]
MNDAAVRRVVLEVEAHVAAAGWDQAPRLYALVTTSELIEAEPALAAQLALDPDEAAGAFTPIEQDELPVEQGLEEMLGGIMWPPGVAGCAAVVERLVLPPGAEGELADDAEQARAVAAQHPGRQEVRMAVAVTRDGRGHCALRLRSHDDAADVLDGADLVPTLVGLLSQTLTD